MANCIESYSLWSLVNRIFLYKSMQSTIQIFVLQVLARIRELSIFLHNLSQNIEIDSEDQTDSEVPNTNLLEINSYLSWKRKDLGTSVADPGENLSVA